MEFEVSNPGVVVHAAGDLRVQEMGEPAPASGEAVVEVAYGGICGSDLHYWQHGAAGASILREPMILGHEMVGTVIAAAADGTGPSAGTRVGIHPLTPHGDGVTPWPADRPNLAPASTYLGSAMHLPHTQGGFA
ncbi:alcohol dehydrogenase catalytic domain-containing protein, partial [Microbacterium sp.]|uniref:alcohol dehydrogenase catalytic domain-containing protein n=1 Tax=Microbacterium sp. TaxID=51671 RepID=UPI003C76FA33